jgi:hypothetical protein
VTEYVGRHAAARPLAGAYLDLENLFHQDVFKEDGEYVEDLPRLREEMENDPAHTEDDKDLYANYREAAAKKPGLMPVPRVVDYFADWLDDAFDLRARRTYGAKWNKGVQASVQRFKDRGWQFKPARGNLEAADQDLVAGLSEDLPRTDWEIFVVGTGDSKRPELKRNVADGIITEAVKQVQVARNTDRSPDPRLVIVIGPPRNAPGEYRWDDPLDLAGVDQVFRLSKVVYQQIRSLKTEPTFEPRRQAGPLDQEDNRRVQAWTALTRNWSQNQTQREAVEKRVEQRIKGLQGYQLRREWFAYSHAVLKLIKKDRERLNEWILPILHKRLHKAEWRLDDGAATTPYGRGRP